MIGTDRPVVVGVDGSPESRAAADWAAREAAALALPLVLVHAWVEEPLYGAPAPEREAADRLLDQAVAEVSERHPALSVRGELLAATATEGLTAVSEEAEMLVLGSRGHGALVGFLLGSVGLPVIAHAARPVVLVRPADGRAHPVEGSLEGSVGGVVEGAEGSDEVVVGLKDLGPAVVGPLDFAFTAAAARGAAVRAVRAWGTPSLFGSDVPGDPAAETEGGLAEREGRALVQVLDPWRQRYPGVPVIEHVRFGNASEVLLSAAAFRAALVVVGRRRHRPRLGPRVGPVVHAALHHARPPVAVVPYD
ncbi:universal stress protein [Streptomyces sp. B6B3]|uniref:universal stress protein n=1 Tax=Streptomyces sp. B6B3 TaxID=3153570 RepID=UPI00325E913D